MTPSERIKFMRQQQGWTQAELGAELGISQVLLHQYESGKKHPGPDTIKMLSRAFDSSSFLIDESNWSYVPLKTDRDIIGLVIELIKRGIVILDGSRSSMTEPIEQGTAYLRMNPVIAKTFFAAKDTSALKAKVLKPAHQENEKTNYTLRFADEHVEWCVLAWHFRWQQDDFEKATRYELEFSTNPKPQKKKKEEA